MTFFTTGLAIVNPSPCALVDSCQRGRTPGPKSACCVIELREVLDPAGNVLTGGS